MGCCSPFTAVTTASAADPGRHVNFTSGMVLGVDDYRQEFAYHSARDKWIVRDFLGYGTLSGLAVTVEDTPEGPRVRVTPGAAAAPSGQLICVGREQCGALNAWLARDDVQEELRKRTEGTADPDHTKLNLYLTLCYTDCAVAEVPIPGEPCRSDENLMAPSRIADDYVLNFAWDPPPMAEAQAQGALDALWRNVSFGASNTPAVFAEAMRKAELQLRLGLGLYPADAPAPTAVDLQPIEVAGESASRFRAALRNLWVTRFRPLIAAQRCSAPAVPANDCVLLAQLRFPVVKAVTHWEVDGGTPAVALDETSRPVLLSTAVAQSSFGIEVSNRPTPQTQPVLSVITTDGDSIGADFRIVVVRSDTPISVKLPVGGPGQLGRELTVKAGGKGDVTLTVPVNTMIDGGKTLLLPAQGSVSLVCDGNKAWYVTGIVK